MFVGRLVGWLVGWSVGRLVGLFVGAIGVIDVCYGWVWALLLFVGVYYWHRMLALRVVIAWLVLAACSVCKVAVSGVLVLLSMCVCAVVEWCSRCGWN